jgi:4-diphosphocytidyl-2-C-methyl-D-erythritol kinase
VLGRRADGYHTLDSLVTFADVADRLTLEPGGELSLKIRGANAKLAGELDDNLVLKAARGLAHDVPGLKLGAFALDKRLPVAAGLGGGSSDAAAALRLLARINRMPANDSRLYKVAQRVGADVPVCVDARPRRMRGIGEILSGPLALPKLAAVLVNPGVAVPTRDVFALLKFKPGEQREAASQPRTLPSDPDRLIEYLSRQNNDLEAAAIKLQPVIARVLTALRRQPGCQLARMSGSGATCFGLFLTKNAAVAAAKKLNAAQPRWWAKASILG